MQKRSYSKNMGEVPKRITKGLRHTGIRQKRDLEFLRNRFRPVWTIRTPIRDVGVQRTSNPEALLTTIVGCLERRYLKKTKRAKGETKDENKNRKKRTKMTAFSFRGRLPTLPLRRMLRTTAASCQARTHVVDGVQSARKQQKKLRKTYLARKTKHVLRAKNILLTKTRVTEQKKTNRNVLQLKKIRNTCFKSTTSIVGNDVDALEHWVFFLLPNARVLLSWTQKHQYTQNDPSCSIPRAFGGTCRYF